MFLGVVLMLSGSGVGGYLAHWLLYDRQAHTPYGTMPASHGLIAATTVLTAVCFLLALVGLYMFLGFFGNRKIRIRP